MNNNSELSDKEFADYVMGTAKKQMEDECGAKVTGMICPVHNKPAQIRAIGNSLDDLHPEIIACCKEFRIAVSKKLL